MRIYLDTEFYEDGSTIDLMSIGMVREDGVQLYLINGYCDWNKPLKDHWHRGNTLKSLLPDVLHGAPHVVSPRRIMQQVHLLCSRKDIIGSPFSGIAAGDSYRPLVPEFWAWYGGYDWVALCQLFGRMLDLPEGWPMYCRDFKQTVDENPWFTKSEETGGHNAIGDALWLQKEHERFLLEQAARAET